MLWEFPEGKEWIKQKSSKIHRWFTLACSSVIQASSKSIDLSRTFPSFTSSTPITQRSSRADDSLPVSAPIFSLVFKQSPTNKCYVAKLLIDTARRRRLFSQTNQGNVKISVWGMSERSARQGQMNFLSS